MTSPHSLLIILAFIVVWAAFWVWVSRGVE